MMAIEPPFAKKRVLTVDISLGTFDEHVHAIGRLAGSRTSSYVCCVNAHMTMEARDPVFAAVVNGADMATADGMPIVKSLSYLHGIVQERVAGNDLLPALLVEAEQKGLSVFLYGGADSTLQLMLDRITKEHPALRVAGTWSPPYGPVETMDFDAEAARINESGAHLVMVSLGCPKQERWMANMKDKVHGVMLGLGGAFLLYAGLDDRAPQWMRNASLEWLYRLALEPRRLWKRYLVTNTQFLFRLAKELASPKSSRKA